MSNLSNQGNSILTPLTEYVESVRLDLPTFEKVGSVFMLVVTGIMVWVGIWTLASGEYPLALLSFSAVLFPVSVIAIFDASRTSARFNRLQSKEPR